MGEKKVMVQSTIRLEDDMLREAQYYLSLERSNVTKFVTQKMREFVQEYRKAHPERVPGGANVHHRSTTD